MTSPRPFVKMVGGKGQIVEELLKHVPEEFKAYHEPMAGGGALFWAMVRGGLVDGKRVVLGDLDEDLIQTYREVRDTPKRLIRTLQLYAEQYVRQGGDLFYRIRDAWNEGVRSPARFIFLKQTSFNGMWRYNRKGKLNMPWGKYERPKILDAENIWACSQALQDAGTIKGDFHDLMQLVGRGDLVYFDPPYWGCFDLYGPDGFTQSQQVRLLKLCGELCRAGVSVIYTNEDGPDVRQLLQAHWPEAQFRSVGSRRYVNCNGGGREPVMDLIAYG